MAISSNNTIKTSYQTELVALRGAESAPYFTVGSKAYIPDAELVNKRKGQTYGYVIRDAGEVENQLNVGANAKKTIVEREVQLSIEPWHNYVENNVVEGKTDLQFDVEVAQNYGTKLIQAAVKKSIGNDFVKSAACFVGKVGEFEPLSMATGHLNSITSEALYGFVDPMIEAIVTSKGAQFVPVDAPAMYKQGLIGHFHGADYRAQRFIPRVNISSVLATAFTGASFSAFNASTNTLTITLGASPASATVIKKGTPIFLDGVVACDLVGDETTAPYAFIVTEDKSIATTDSTVAVKVDEVPVVKGGTRVASMADGSEIDWTSLSASASIPAAGVYFAGLVRANGAYNFQTLNDIDVATPDSKKGSVQGITVFQNRLTDLDNFVTGTRFDTFTLAGVVEKRAQVLVLIKAN
jgi:hypothetical protein